MLSRIYWHNIVFHWLINLHSFLSWWNQKGTYQEVHSSHGEDLPEKRTPEKQDGKQSEAGSSVSLNGKHAEELLTPNGSNSTVKKKYGPLINQVRWHPFLYQWFWSLSRTSWTSFSSKIAIISSIEPQSLCFCRSYLSILKQINILAVLLKKAWHKN
jgi:hypothetical protein